MTRVPLAITVFHTKLGPMGVVESGGRVLQSRVGAKDLASLERELFALYPDALVGSRSAVADLLVQYARGEIIDFAEVEIEDGHLSSFRRRVTGVARAIPYGETATYSELAERAGSPNAYRAAGSTMAKNPWTILVPCHRVLARGGLGGYSAPQGLELKQRLLGLEAKQIS